MNADKIAAAKAAHDRFRDTCDAALTARNEALRALGSANFTPPGNANGYPLPIPEDIALAIAEHEAKRLGLEPSDNDPREHFAAYFPNFSTDSPGYVGPLVVVVWAADCGALSSYIMKDGAWTHCNSSAW